MPGGVSYKSCLFFFSSRRRHTRCLSDWSSDVCSSDLGPDLLLGFGRQVHEVLLEDAENAVQAPVDLLDGDMVERLGHDAGHACVDDGGGAARLAYQDISYELIHVKNDNGLSGQ